MKSLLRVSALISTAVLGTLATANVARAQTTIMISMTAAPATPRLQGPFSAAASPATPFLFAIPATGQAPLTFTATGLPSGLTIAASTGIISGTMPAAGSYPVAVTVTNASGMATATYTLLSGSTLAPTPPMGWNSYDSYGASVTQQDMLDQADAVRTYLQPYGWNYVVIDYRWYESGQPIDANGRYLPNTTKYPSATGTTGFTSLANQIHAKGVKFGIHIMRGVPRKSYDASSPIANSTYTARQAGNTSDPCPWDTHMWGASGTAAAVQAWYDALMAQYASWGVDFIKIDDMLNNSTRQYHAAEADAIRRAIEKTGRSIMLSFSPGPDDPSWLPNSIGNLNMNASMWRVVNDFWDHDALTDLPGVFRAANTWQGVSARVAGHWPDLDMLPLGFLGPRPEWAGHAPPGAQTTFTRNEQVTIMTLWSMLPSPLMYGGNPARLSSDAWTLALLTNEEVLAVNQDTLGAAGRRTAMGSNELWVRDLRGGDKAVAFFNRGTQDATMSATFTQLGVTGTPTIRDLWRRANVTATGTSLSASVPGGAALMYRIAAPGGGMGGMGGMGGVGGMGGAPGGASGTGGTSGTGTAGGASGGAGTGGNGAGAGGASAGTAGANATGGTANGGVGGAAAGTTSTTGGASGTTATGGTTSTGGTSPTGGAGGTTTTGGTATGGAGNAPGTTGDDTSDPSGCGCAVPRRDPSRSLLLLAAALALGVRRRLNRLQPPCRGRR